MVDVASLNLFLNQTEYIHSMFDVGRSMFDVHQFLFRSDWTLAASGAAYVKLHKIRCRSKKYLTAEIAEYAEII